MFRLFGLVLLLSGCAAPPVQVAPIVPICHGHVERSTVLLSGAALTTSRCVPDLVGEAR